MPNKMHNSGVATISAPEFVLGNLKKKNKINRILRSGKIAVIIGEPGTGKTLLAENCLRNHTFIKPTERDHQNRYILSTEVAHDKKSALIIDDAFLFNKESLKKFAEYTWGKRIKLIITASSPEDIPGIEPIADYIRLEIPPVNVRSPDNNKDNTFQLDLPPNF
ncbi:TPA: ATP-binding protein [Salmonella enterica]|uniref:nSTAND3 domain-containing NTPase n=1 Tax=Enterobacter roggenkampii TaxID=1812935 RepID=UPI0019AA1AA9|nr:ATP-binding protein [Salmonella enterica subsp. enterica serovar Orion]HAK7474983.1 ATP-binding protein [Salmonella enterica]EJR7832874.1 ATP-binding protein [Salmonella enterica subsp. enterica serovar Orion]HAK8236158.1 ATP-binding protein [Salmonella enterica]HAK8531567.1 ATP-binding protein [Salmonella enterica]